jgi:Glycosyltransferase family 87
MSHRHRMRSIPGFLCLGLILLHLMVFWQAREQILAGLPDFRIFYTAGLMLRRGEGHVLYDDALQSRTQREFVPASTADNSPLPYNHPPFEAVLYVPFTYIQFLRAYSVWFLINGLLLAISIYTVRPWIPRAAAEFPELLFLAPLAFFPVFYAFMQGQDSILLLTLYCLAYAAFRREKDVQAGVWLGLGLFKFHLVLPFAFILLLARRWRAIGGFALTAAAEVIVSWAIVGWRELLYYPRYAWHVNRLEVRAVIIPQYMPNLRGLLTGWNESAAMRWRLELLVLVASLCLVLWASRQWISWDLLHAEAWNTRFSIALITTFLVGYHGYNQDLSIVLLAIAITINGLIESDNSMVDTALRVVVGLMFLSPLYLLLTLRYNHQNLFALVPLAFVFCLWASCSGEKGQPQGSHEIPTQCVAALDSRLGLGSSPSSQKSCRPLK